MERLELEDYLLIAEAILGVDAKTLKGYVDIGLAESALAAPFAGYRQRAAAAKGRGRPRTNRCW